VNASPYDIAYYQLLLVRNKTSMLTFKRLNLAPCDWEVILNTFPDHTIFQTPAWLSFVANTQDAEPVLAELKDGINTVGYFTGLIVRKFGFRILGSPFPGWTTSYMGFNLVPDIPRYLALNALTRFAFTDLRCAHLEIMDRQVTVEDAKRSGFAYRMYAGYEIDLTQSEDKLFAGMTSACRRAIRKSEKNGVQIEEADPSTFVDDYYAQLTDVFAKQSLAPTYNRGRVQQLIDHLYPTGRLLLLQARDPEGRCIATGLFPALHRTMYFWGGASWRQYQLLRPNEAVQWYAMRYWKARGIQRCDMVGGGEYKQKYGTYDIAIPWLRKSKYDSLARLRYVAQRLVRIYQRVQGWRKS
jgi:Acetyltransferase (GNAT) domain